VALVCVAGVSVRADDSEDRDAWDAAGGNIQDTHTTQASRALDPANVPALTLKWVFNAAGNITGTPAVDGDAVYVADWGGKLHKVDRRTGRTLWSHSVSEYTGNSASFSRSSPAVNGHTVVIGDQVSATIIAVDRDTGALLWKTVLDPHPLATITGSPVIAKGRVYIGVASQEEVQKAVLPTYVPTFRGQAAALDLETGAIVWQFRTVPPGYTGGAVWNSTQAVDENRNLIYVGVGNNYTVPLAVQDCIEAATTPEQALACRDPADLIDSVLGIDLDDGHLKWAFQTRGSDTFTALCLFQPATCPIPFDDFDFGAGPNLFRLKSDGPQQGGGDGRPREILGIGQKSGIYYALDPDNGRLLWATMVGPSGLFGGIEWGTAADGEHVYVSLSNSEHKPYQLQPSGQPHNSGSWAALDAETGRILWQTKATGQDPRAPAFGSLALGSVSAANGVMYAGATGGDFVALDGASGKILWTFPSGGTPISGPAIVNDTLYWGTGYNKLGLGIPNNKLYSFFAPVRTN
jgi:polyvinyl alcohol dehydrogenase (cytochrome)